MSERIEEREARKMILGAERADDATAVEAYRAIAENCRNYGVRAGAATAIESLCDRLVEANRKIATGTNYVCDREVRPFRAEFANGRVVELVADDEGSFLEIGWR